MTAFTLADLEAIVAARAASDDEMSYTRKLVGKGVGKCAQKLGEEAVEAAIAAVQGDRAGLKGKPASRKKPRGLQAEARAAPEPFKA
jgi:phosphoribosyl-ATP pyrophosphohydrolase